MNRSEGTSVAGPRLRRPGAAGKVIVAVGLAAGLVLAGLGTYDYVQSEFGGTTLVILTYPSLFGGNCGGSPAFSSVFGGFAAAHGIRIEVVCPAGTAYSWLVDQAGTPTADLVVGLDEITAPQAEAAGLLIPYAPPGLANVSPALVQELAPDVAGVASAIPYEYGYLAIDYNTSFYRATAGAVGQLNFSELANNPTWAGNLLLEDPQTDITGEEFLVWEIEYYENVLHQNWTMFWRGMPPGDPPLSDTWGDAYAQYFYAGPEQMLVSYSTDPACAADPSCAPYPDSSAAFNATVSWYHGKEYGWKTIYGVGIVNGTRHLALDEAFENWLLSGTVQEEIPTNEWEYPANTTVALPSYYAAAIPPGPIYALNNDTTPATVGASVAGWVATWAAISSGRG
jgi:thiamine transport system substrate-binding protein